MLPRAFPPFASPLELDGQPERRDMAQDLPGYLDQIKRSRPDDLLVVSKEMDPAYEITALVVKLEREARRRPVVICERVQGHRRSRC